MLLGIQLIGILFGFFMLYLTFLYLKKNTYTYKEWISWSGIWIIFLFLSVFPQFLDPLLVPLHLYRAMDFFISVGFMLSIMIIFYAYSVMRTNQKKIEAITREVALFKQEMEDRYAQLQEGIQKDRGPPQGDR